ncbi:MAG: iron ABC transporter permease [Clostridiales Family XIII bacterium]|jgi:iron complex transport system permease protein|nr:iron ABC transporter permease [Clostridiales Family XIII bacterium]
MDKIKQTGSSLDAKIKFNIEAAEHELFRDEKIRHKRIDRRARTLAALAVMCAIAYFVCLFLPDNITVNAAQHNLAWYFEMTSKNISVFFNTLAGTETSSTRWHLTQYLIVALVGMALSVNGAVYQGAFRNALASPTTLGVQTGGALGGTVYILLFYREQTGITYALTEAQNRSVFERYGQSVFMMVGCFMMVAFVLFVARRMNRGGRPSSIGLVLSGLVFGGTVGSVLGLIQYYLLMNDPEGGMSYALRYIMMGTFDYVYTPLHLLLIGTPIILCMAVVMALRKKLNLLAFGEDEARTMGVNVDRIRRVAISVATVLTAVIISFCGMIGFIGFMVPHVARRMVGPDFNYLIPGSGLLGALIMMVVFHVGRAFGLASTIGLMTSLVGGSIFMLLLLTYRRRGHADWA